MERASNPVALEAAGQALWEQEHTTPPWSELLPDSKVHWKRRAERIITAYEQAVPQDQVARRATRKAQAKS